MKTRLLLPLALLVGCGPAIEPAERASLLNPLVLEPPPIYSLIGFRQDLELTSEQIVALDSIAQAVAEETEPLRAELRQQAASQSRRYRGAVVVSEQTRPQLERIRDANRAAVRAVEELLTPEQEGEVCRLFDSERREGARSRAARRPATPRREPAAGDTTLFRPGPIWVWCTPGAAEG